MSEIELNQQELRIQAEEIKIRLLSAAPAEGIVMEIASLHCAMTRLQQTLKSQELRLQETEAGIQEAVERRQLEFQLYIEKLELKVKSLETALAARDVFAVAKPDEKHVLSDSARVEADYLLTPENGFYNLEHDAKGRPFRWTGPGTSFTFHVYIDRSEARIGTANFLAAIEPKMLPSVQCYVDSILAESRYVAEADWHAICFGIPPRKRPDNTRTTITFVAPSVVSPMAIDADSSDSRRLGLAFWFLTAGSNTPKPQIRTPSLRGSKPPSDEQRSRPRTTRK